MKDVCSAISCASVLIILSPDCERELELAEKRKRKKLNRNAEPFDPPKVRLQLFSRTNMEIMELAGIHVESHDLLFVLSSFPVLQELKLVDLPWLEDAVFYPNTGLPGFPPIQRLTFSNTPQVRAAGLVTYLAQPQNREVLTELNLSKTGVQAHHLYLILSKAPYLTKVSVSEDVERSIPLSPPTPALTSSSLKILHFEITARHSAHHNIHPPTESYYSYLASSLLSNSLPSLTDLFVRDPEFPETLLLPLPPHGRPFSSYSNTAASSPPTSPGFAPPAGLSQPLSIYTKGQDDLEWNFTSIAPPSSAGRGGRSATRPISLMGAESLSPAWGGSARKSVIVGNGLGGFLAVPSEELPRRPESSSSNKSVGESSWAGLTGSHGLPDRSKKERKDLWR
ncbi:putative f-box domain protein [Phaeomoniella chlamydospora]|uniref:Putative f-box domain protein n=1 Tax=Phaeomoniella chlamydospora TaxID=158046 RepID=A0A0G2ELG6_PHACM|nr:putative f-box domain protein [Phaeomoniella chlamydospora]